MPQTLVRGGAYLAVPLTSGRGLLSAAKLKKHDQELTLGWKVGLLQESGYTPGRHRTAGCSHIQTWSAELVEQGLGVLQVGGVKPLGEPAVDRCQEVVRLGTPTLIAPQPSKAGGRTQLPETRALPAGDS